MGKPMNPKESEIQREICDWLNRAGFFFWRANNIPVFGRSNDGQKRFRALPKYTPKGIPDILILSNGVLIGLEVKRGGVKKVRPEQEIFGEKMECHGGRYHVVHSLTETQVVLSTVAPLVA